MAAFKVRDQLSTADHQLLDPWLKAQAQRVQAFWDNPKNSRNNHLYWAGFAITATGAVTGDEALWAKGRSFYDEGLTHIAKNGVLELEMARANMALHYHNYALMPLAAMAELARVRGENWFERGNGKIFVLADLVIEGWTDPAWFAAQTGKKQTIPSVGNLSWTIWFLDQPIRNKAQLIELTKKGPFYNTQIGGDPAMTQKSATPARHWYWPFS
jgi:poly(beta-D-mannuronate) lyase